MKKFVRRNRLAVAAGAAAVVALIVGISLSTWQAVRATRAKKGETAHRTKAEASEKRAQASARDATASLYESLVGQARATRIARQVGYREEVFALLCKARDLDTPAKQLAALRREAVASMGDFVGFRPRQIASAPATNRFDWVVLSPDGRLLVLRDWTGGIQLHELPSGREVSRWQLEQPVRNFAFSTAGDRLITIQVPRGTEDRAGARVTEFAPNLTGKWQPAGSRPVPGAFGCFSINNSTVALVADRTGTVGFGKTPNCPRDGRRGLAQAPQLHDSRLDQALLVLALAMKQARRSKPLRPPPPQSRFNDHDVPF